MRHIKDFFHWLFDLRTPTLFPVLFSMGMLFGVVMAIFVAFAISPAFGISVILLLTIGVPVAAYMISKTKGGN